MKGRALTMTKNKRSSAFSPHVKFAVMIILLILVVIPIINLFSGIRISDFKTVLASSLFGEALKNSVLLSLIATVFSVVLAYVLALCMVRTDIPGKRAFGVFLTLPMLIPSISHGIGLISLFGNNGIITQVLGTPAIYGPVGIVAGSVMYAFPVAYIMLSDVLKYEDTSVYEAADVLGIGKIRQFFRLSLPYLKKPLIATVFSTFSLIFTDYGVPSLVGGRTYTISFLMFTEVASATGGSFGKSIVYALFLLVPAAVAFVTDAVNKENGTSSFVKKGHTKKTSVPLRIVSFLICFTVSCAALMPILSFAVQAFVVSYPRDMTFTLKQVQYTIEQRGLEYLANSLFIAFVTAIIGTALSYITAYLTSRMRSTMSRIIHLMVLTFMAIPGLVLGLSYAMTFKQTVLYGTVVIIIMANVAHFMSSPYLMMYNSFGKMNENLEAVGQTLGVSRVRMLKDVFIPQNRLTIAEMFTYLFVNSMMTISAVSFLATTTTRPISLMISQFKDNVGGIELAAVVSIVILVTNLAVKGLLSLTNYVITIQSKRRKEKYDIIKKTI